MGMESGIPFHHLRWSLGQPMTAGTIYDQSYDASYFIQSEKQCITVWLVIVPLVRTFIDTLTVGTLF